MKEQLTSGYGSAVYVPPMMAPRLRSVIASASGTLSSSTAASHSLDYDWRGSQAPAQNPAGGENAYGYFRQPSSSYARYAYDDYSEDDSDRDMDTSSTSSNKVSAYFALTVPYSRQWEGNKYCSFIFSISIISFFVQMGFLA